MDLIQIAELQPELSARASKQFKAAVTLIWPYSSSQRQFALLLAEPDFRLRRKKGQVRARFHGSSARALATTGVGIGDEVILSLKGAQFVQEGTVNTPGRSIDWELEYTQTLSVQVFRDGNEIATLELTDVASTPAPRSPIRLEPTAAPSPIQAAHQWASPAFLKRLRLSDGPIFEAPYDPLADEQEGGHDKKRRRKSYKDWKAWTYSARTPSPEKDDVEEEDFEEVAVSPIRPTQLPHTPVSPSRLNTVSTAPEAQDRSSDSDVHQQANVGIGQDHTTAKRSNKRDFVQLEQHDDLYAGPDDIPPSDAQYAFGGDTEANTEEDDLHDDTEGVSMSATEVNTEDPGDSQRRIEEEILFDSASIAHDQRQSTPSSESPKEEDILVEVESNILSDMRSPSAAHDEEEFSAIDIEEISGNTPVIVMPPPNPLALDTNLETHITPGLLTPIGREPASPTLQPLDSATLPLPSPFPGERDVNITSFLDHIAADSPAVNTKETKDAGEELPSDASYIMETSFFSSIGSSKTPALHPDHETAFTPVRFTFGFDGTVPSRHLELSSPAPESTSKETHQSAQAATDAWVETPSKLSVQSNQEATLSTRASNNANSSPANEAEAEITSTEIVEPSSRSLADETIKASSTNVVKTEPAVIVLSSGSEDEDEEEEEEDDDQSEDAEEESEMEDLEQIEDDEDEHEEEESEGESDMVEEGTDENEIEEEDDSMEHGSSPVKQISNEEQIESAIAHLSARTSDIIELDVVPDDENNSQNDTVTITDSNNASLLKDAVGMDPMDGFSNIIQNDTEFMDLDPASEFLDFGSDPQSIRSPHIIPQQSLRTTAFGQQDPMIEENPQSVLDQLDVDMRQIESTYISQDDLVHTGQADPHIKVESIEEDDVAHLKAPDSQLEDGERDVDGAAESGQMMIEVPEEGDKIGDLHTIAVPSTAPARNTRSKAKASASPTKNEPGSSKRTTRSTNSKTTNARSTISPPRMRKRSTLSPTQESGPTSPYRLRSQSKLLSPTMEAKRPSATRQSPRKHVSQKSLDSIPNINHTQPDDRDPFGSSVEPSQNLDMSQGRYSDVSFVKDSEEESLHSEHTIANNKYSEEWNTYTNFCDPPVMDEQDSKIVQLTFPPSTAPETRSRVGAKAKWKQSGGQIVIPKSSPIDPEFSDAMQPPSGSPVRRLRSASSATSRETSTSPRIVRTTRRRVYNKSPSPPHPNEDEYQPTPKASQLRHQDSKVPLAAEDEAHLRSSPPPVSVSDRDSFSVAMDSNKLITPDATQQTYAGSQPDPPAAQQQTLPITPQLTQATSNIGTHEDTPKAHNTRAASITKSTPRRNMTQSDVASPSTSSKENSPDISSDMEPTTTSAPEQEQPTIGLSTPIAYYTPLNSLTYFLNRSSQFHTASNPDILALVTSSSTTPQRATKGPKHWNTTLHITDASNWPTTTTVNIFRAYQTALPNADPGDIILLRAFAVKSLNRHPTLISADESSWCVWRYNKPLWGYSKRGAYAELRAREEVKGPEVERGEGEWREVEKLRKWFLDTVKAELERREKRTRSGDKTDAEEGGENAVGDGDGAGAGGEKSGGHRYTRSQDKGKESSG